MLPLMPDLGHHADEEIQTMRTPIQALAIAAPVCFALSLFPACSHAQTARIKDCQQLTEKDHTSVIHAIQGKLVPVAGLAREQNIDVRVRSPQTSRSLLLAISKSRILDSATSRKLDLAALCMSLAPASSIPERSRMAVRDIALELDKAGSVPNALETLGRLKNKYTEADDIREALTVASSVLQDGRQTIYNDKQPVFQTLASASAEQSVGKSKSASEHARDLAIADAKGALNGAVGGCIAGLLAGGVGCGPGALAGGVAAGIGNSAQELVEKAWEYVK